VKKELPFLVTKAKMPSFNTLIFPILWHQNLKNYRSERIINFEKWKHLLKKV
jgi:hypothetical protein